MDDLEDSGPSIGVLWALGWALGVVALGCLIRVGNYPEPEDAATPSGLFAWTLAGGLAGVASACSAVLAGVKRAERRLAARTERATT